MSALGNLVVSLALDTAAFTKGVDKSSYEAQKFAQDLDRTLNRSLGLVSEGFKGFAAGALGAVGVTLTVGAAVSKLNDTFARMDDLLKNSQRFGIQVEELSKLGFAAQMSGVQTDKLGDALKDLLKNAAEAAAGSKGPKQAFDALGVSVQDLDGKIKPASKLIEEISGRFSQLPDGALKSNAAMKIFGESGLALIPMLNAGEEGIRKMNEEAERFGLVVSTDAAKAAELYNDNLARLTAQVDGLFNTAANFLLPSLVEVTNELLAGTAAAKNFGDGIQVALSKFTSDKLREVNPSQRIAEIKNTIKVMEGYANSGGLGVPSVMERLIGFDKAGLDRKKAELKLYVEELDKEINSVLKPPSTLPGGGETAVAKIQREQEEKLARDRKDRIDKLNALLTNLNSKSDQSDQKFKTLNTTIDDQIQKVKEQLGQTEKATEADKLRAKAMDLMKGNIDGVTEAKLKELEALEKSNKVYQEEIKLLKQRAAAASALVDSATKEARAGADSAAQRTKQLEDEIARIGLKSEAIAELEARTLELRAAELRQQADALGGPQSGETAEEMLRQAVELERQIALVREKSAKEVALQRMEDERQANKEIVDNFVDLFKDVSTKSGKQFADDLKRSLEVQFRSYVLRVGVEAALGVNSKGETTGGGLLGSIGSDISGSLLKESIKSGFTAALSSSAAYAAAVPGLTSAAAGSQAALLAAQTAEFGAAGTLATASAGGSAAAGFASTALSAAPYIAAAVLVYNMLKTKKISASNLGAEFSQPVTVAIEEGFKTALSSLGGVGGATFSVAGNTGRQGENPNFNIRAFAADREVFYSGQTADGAADGLFQNGEIALNDANIAEQTTRAIVAALKLSDFADNIDAVIGSLDPLNGSLDELNAGLANAQLLAGVNSLTETAGVFATLSGASLETVQSLLSLTGGLEGLQAGNQAFYDAFTRDTQKAADLTEVVTEAFAQFGREVPTTRDGLVALRDSLDLQDESQAKLFATINDLTPALDQLLPAFDAVGQSASDNVQALESVADAYARLTNVQLTNEQIAQQRISLEQRLAEATGGTEAAAAAARAAIAPYNLALYDQVVATEQAQQAIAAAQQQAAAVLQERSGLETRLLQLQGNTAALRQRELAAVDGSNRAILQQIIALEDAQQAQREFAQQVQQTEQALSAAQSRLSSAQSAVASAQSAIDQVRDQATQNYLSTQSRVIAAQQRLNELQNESARRIQQVGASISEFLNTLRRDRFGTDTPQRVRESLLAEFSSNQIAALSGDAGAAERAQAIASELLGVSKEFFGSTQRFQSDLDFVTSELQKIVALGGSASVEEQNPLVAAQNELTAAQQALVESTNVANAIGASLVESQTSLIDAFNQAAVTLSNALIEQVNAQSAVTIAQRQLDALNQINGSVGSLNSSLIASLGQLGASLTNSLAQGFESLDLNVDGGISQEEFAQAFASFGLGEKLNAIFSEIDVNGNGLIDRTEAVRAQTEAVNSNTASALNPLGQITGNTGATFNATDALQRFFEQTLNFSGNGLAVSLAANQNTNAVRGVAGLVAEAVTGLSAQQGGLLVRSIQQTVSQPVRFRDGGLVAGPGTGTSDSIPALLSNREFVVNAASTRSVGEDSLKFINRTGRLPANPVGVPVGSNNAEVVAELRALRAEMQRMDSTIALQIVTPDGKVQREETIRQIRERSRRGELVVYAEGVK